MPIGQDRHGRCTSSFQSRTEVRIMWTHAPAPATSRPLPHVELLARHARDGPRDRDPRCRSRRVRWFPVRPPGPIRTASMNRWFDPATDRPPDLARRERPLPQGRRPRVPPRAQARRNTDRARLPGPGRAQEEARRASRSSCASRTSPLGHRPQRSDTRERRDGVRHEHGERPSSSSAPHRAGPRAARRRG